MSESEKGSRISGGVRILSAFWKRETVFCIAAVLALLSMLLVRPSAAYLQYFDFRVLVLLYCLMLTVAGLREMGAFEILLQKLLKIIHSTRQLAGALIMICFFTSMWITNDVALLTFVPFTVMTLHRMKQDEILIPVIVLQTIAANLGSMCTPVGNPQNLYLFTVSGMQAGRFVRTLLPYTVLSFLLLSFSILWFHKKPLESGDDLEMTLTTSTAGPFQMIAFGSLFFLCLFTVFRILDYRILLVIIVTAVFLLRKRLLAQADYVLLLTFAAFFIFVGNMKQLEAVDLFLQRSTAGHEILISVLLSQVISNVPAAVLLSGFTDNFAGLMIGTDIGGLGTLIASMASLISYKIYCCTSGCRRKRYLLAFTAVNLVFLVFLLLAAAVFSHV